MAKKRVSILQREGIKLSAFRTVQPPPNKPSASDAARRQQPAVWLPHSPIDRQAAAAVGKLLAADAARRGGASVKSLTLAPHVVEKKATHAVTCNTLKYLSVLEDVVEQAGVLTRHEGKLLPEVAYVLAYEVLLGQGCRKSGPAERALMSARDAMTRALEKLLKAAGVESADDLLPAPPAPHPRTARVNTLKMSVAEALTWLRDPPAEHARFAKLGRAAEMDPLLPDVLVFPPRADLHDHPLAQNGSLVLQSKASCMPAHALRPEPGWHIVDCCAAPGNKTTHVAALLGGSGKVWAFDMDAARLARLQANAAIAGAGNVVATQADFLQVDVTDERYAQVRGVLLDPSCSGSGTAANRLDALLPSRRRRAAESDELDEAEAARVEGLARFQEAALRHALRFPALQRLVYSTCSVHARENEDVVAAVLSEARELGFDLTDPFPSWHRRGLGGRVEHAERLVRTDAAEDGTDGFFVAVFQRQSGEHRVVKEAAKKGKQGRGVVRKLPKARPA